MKKSLFLFMCIAMMFSSVHAGTVKVYAAASLNNAVTEISRIYQARHPQTKIITIFGASSALAKQIEAGASSDLFFSADQDWMNYLVHKKLINSSSVHPVLLNQLVAISPKHLNIHFKPQSSFNFRLRMASKGAFITSFPRLIFMAISQREAMLTKLMAPSASISFFAC